jgi:hypothetical protein
MDKSVNFTKINSITLIITYLHIKKKLTTLKFQQQVQAIKET